MRTFLIVACSVAAACTSLTVRDNDPLATVSADPSGPLTPGGYRLTAIPDNGNSDELLLLLAFSGGGKRSSSFSYGVLKGLRELQVDFDGRRRRLLDEIDLITGVSGGSFTATYYGLHREKTFESFAPDFLYTDLEAYIYGVFLLPWNWDWLVNPSVGTNDFMAQVYDRLMFQGATFADLAKKGAPVIVMGATDVSWGAPFQFSQDTFDLICSDLLGFPLARAVAASNGLPVLFTPITLVNYRERCSPRLPAWYSRVHPAEWADPLSRRGQLARRAQRYLDPAKTRYVHLLDGGATDNLAMRGIVEQMIVLAGEGQRVPVPLERLRRIVLVSADGEAAQDSSWAQQRVVGGIGQIISQVSGTQIDNYNFETLVLADDQLRHIADKVRTARCERGPTVWDHPCTDVRVGLVHLSLAQISDPEVRARLERIPTALTLAKEDVDLLVEAGRSLVVGSGKLRRIIQEGATWSPLTSLSNNGERATHNSEYRTRPSGQ